MSLYKQGSSPFWRIQFVLGGRTYVKSSKTSVKSVAAQLEVEWKAKIHSRVVMGKLDDITVDQMFKQYFALPLAVNTRRNATSLYNRLAKFTNLKIKATDFHQAEFERFVDSMRLAGVKDSTISAYLRTISGAWNCTNKKIYNVPTLTLPKVRAGKGRTIFFTPDEENQLFTFLRERPIRTYGVGRHNELNDVFTLLFDTGARANEIATLTWDKIDLKNKKIELWRSKTSSESYLVMSNRVHEVLQRRLQTKRNEKWVFPNKKNDNHRTLETQYLNRIIKKAGVVKTVHCIRHGFATKMLKLGMTLVEVQKLLGHATIQTTSRYSHIETSDVSSKSVALLNQQNVEQNRSMIKAV